MPTEVERERRRRAKKLYRLRHPEKHRAEVLRWQVRNTEKRRATQARFRERHPVANIAEKRLRRYGVTMAEYDALLAQQGHSCAICEQPFTDGLIATIDHCHQTSVVRGLLCYACNMALGQLRILTTNWDSSRFYRALVYLGPDSRELEDIKNLARLG